MKNVVYSDGWKQPEPHLIFELRYLVFEVSDVLAGVCVVQLSLYFPFFFLERVQRGKKTSIQSQHQEHQLHLL